MFFDWKKEIQEPLDSKALRMAKIIEFIRISGILCLVILIAGFHAYWLSNHGANFDNLNLDGLLVVLFGAVAIVAFLLWIDASFNNDSFKFLSINDSEHFKKYHELLQSGCPEVEAFDKAIKALKRPPTKGELRALEGIVTEYLKRKAQKAFLERDWSTLDETLSKSIAKSTTEKC